VKISPYIHEVDSDVMKKTPSFRKGTWSSTLSLLIMWHTVFLGQLIVKTFHAVKHQEYKLWNYTVCYNFVLQFPWSCKIISLFQRKVTIIYINACHWTEPIESIHIFMISFSKIIFKTIVPSMPAHPSSYSPNEYRLRSYSVCSHDISQLLCKRTCPHPRHFYTVHYKLFFTVRGH